MKINLLEKFLNLLITIVLYNVYVLFLPILGWRPNEIEVVIYFILPFLVIFVFVTLGMHYLKGVKK